MWGWHLPSFDLSILSFGPSTASPVIVADLFFYLWWISWHLGKWKCQVQYTIFWCNLLWPSPPPPPKKKVLIAACVLRCHCAGLERRIWSNFAIPIGQLPVFMIDDQCTDISWFHHDAVGNKSLQERKDPNFANAIKSKLVRPGPWSGLWFRRSSHNVFPCVRLLATQRNRDLTWRGQRSRTRCWGVSHLNSASLPLVFVFVRRFPDDHAGSCDMFCLTKNISTGRVSC